MSMAADAGSGLDRGGEGRETGCQGDEGESKWCEGSLWRMEV